MNGPLVSICLPNLNTLPYLRERVDTILGQTYTNWELVVSDNFSEDGAWAFFQELARKDARVSAAQAPRRGLYANWNNCIRRARGKYIYIATSDDTMALDCLGKLVAALERHKDCDLAHCPLRVVNEAGVPVAKPKWPDGTVFAQGSAGLLDQPHVRRAPYDGLLHLTGSHVYLSITQLLIRSSLFSRIGGFPSEWGSAGDFNWEMKAGLIANTIHVPDTWATWRRHSKQATPLDGGNTGEWEQKVEEMIQDALRACEAHLEPVVVAGLSSHWLDWARDMRIYYAGLRHRRNLLRRRLHQVAQAFNGTAAAHSELVGRLFGRPKFADIAPTDIRLWLESLGLGRIIAPES